MQDAEAEKEASATCEFDHGVASKGLLCLLPVTCQPTRIAYIGTFLHSCVLTMDSPLWKVRFFMVRRISIFTYALPRFLLKVRSELVPLHPLTWSLAWGVPLTSFLCSLFVDRRKIPVSL